MTEGLGMALRVIESAPSEEKDDLLPGWRLTREEYLAAAAEAGLPAHSAIDDKDEMDCAFRYDDCGFSDEILEAHQRLTA